MPQAPSWPRQAAHPESPCATGSAATSERWTEAHTLGAGRFRGYLRNRPAGDERVRLPFFCGDLLHDLDFEVALGQEFLEPCVLALELPQPLDLVGAHAAEALAPGVDRLLTDAVPLGYLRNRIAVRLAQDAHHLLVGKSCFSQGSLVFGWSHLLKFQLVRKEPGRSAGQTPP